MSPKAEDILQTALRLSDDERARLASLLVESLEAPLEDPREVEEAWREEVERRVDELDSGKVTAIPWEEAWRRIVNATRDSNESSAA